MNLIKGILDAVRPMTLLPAGLTPAELGNAPAGPEREFVVLAKGTSGADKGKKPTVQAGRRRRTDSQGKRQRAEAPRRGRSDEGTQAPPPSGTYARPRPSTSVPRPSTTPRPAGGQISLPIGGRNSLLTIGIVVLLALCAIPVMLITGLFDTGQDLPQLPTERPLESVATEPAPQLPVESVATEPPPQPTEAFELPAPSSGEETWLVMLYQDADDKILEQDIYWDLNEAEQIGSSDRVHIVTQVDRYQAGYQGDGDWTSAKRFYITRDEDLHRVHSQQMADLGEVNMSDGATLVDFVIWAHQTFPADKYVLIMSDHGMGWPGGWSDPAPGGRGDPDIPLSAALGDELYLMEIDEALGEIRTRTGIDKFELIGMDACLMGHLEVYAALAPHARYAVASQETEPAVGWAYAGFLEALVANPDMDGAQLGRLIVDSYIRDDRRFADDQARSELLRAGSPLGGLFSLLIGGGGTASPEQLVQQMEQNITLSAIDLSALPELINSFNALSFALQGDQQPMVARARTYAQSFTSVFGKDSPPSYIDLGSFTRLLIRESTNSDVNQAADRLLSSMSRAVVAEKHGANKSGATGISIYFPTSQHYRDPRTGPQSYTAIASRFASETLWDDYLAFHYTGRAFEPAAAAVVVPERTEEIIAPGAGQIEVSPVTLSDDVAAPGRPVILSADISGQNIGHVYLFVGYYDQESNSIFVADTDYLESLETREIDGVYYPDWGESADFTMEFEWEPLMFAISDGVDSVIAMLDPEVYGAAPEDAVYTVEGLYTYADGGESRYARLYFRDGFLRQVFGFTGTDGTGAPREIIPQTGDTFTVLEKWMDLDQNGRAAQVVRVQGGTLTFGDQMFMWEELDAAPGEYIVGFIVEDLDGNTVEAFTTVIVE